MAKINDLENRSRSLILELGGCLSLSRMFLKQYTRLSKASSPDICAHKLELDRSHRTLGPPRQDGLSCSIVVKPHYYNIKEEVMRRARTTPHIQLMGHSIQIYVDISPLPSPFRKGGRLNPF